MVPEGWITRNLGELITYKKGFAFTSADYSDSGVRIIRISDTTRDSVNSENPVYIPNEVATKLDAHLLSTGDILLTTVGSRPHLIDSMVGKVIRVPPAVSGSLLNQNLVKLIPIEGQVTTEYLFEILRKPKFRHYISTLVRGNANQVSISLSDLFKYKALIPNVREQKKIAQILSTWDKAITTTEQLLDNSQQQKIALMQQLLTGKKRIGEHYGAFEKCRFADLLKIDSNNLGAKTPEDFSFTYISLSDVKPGKINSNLEHYTYKTSPSRAKRLVKAGDVLMSTVRPNLQGFVRVTHKHAECVASTGFSVLSPKERVCGDYIYHYLFSAHIKGQINSLVVGSNYPAISSSDVARLCVYCPQYQEQVEIAAVLNNCDLTIESLNLKLEFLQREKIALMQQLLTGKRRVMVS